MSNQFSGAKRALPDRPNLRQFSDQAKGKLRNLSTRSRMRGN